MNNQGCGLRVPPNQRMDFESHYCHCKGTPVECQLMRIGDKTFCTSLSDVMRLSTKLSQLGARSWWSKKVWQ